jgi:hypothetical protein
MICKSLDIDISLYAVIYLSVGRLVPGALWTPKFMDAQTPYTHTHTHAHTHAQTHGGSEKPTSPHGGLTEKRKRCTE